MQEVRAPRPGGPQRAGGGGRRSQGCRLRAGQGPPGEKIAFLLGSVANPDPSDPSGSRAK